MKSIRAFLFPLFLASPVFAVPALAFPGALPAPTVICCTVSGVTVEEVIPVLAEYTQLSVPYLRENLMSFVSLGYNENLEEHGTITIGMDDGPVTWNWRLDGGSNVVVVWPT
ncbi:MAG TPA: hypothetical protein VHS96_00975 [Bacteroidia bacterium]|nr:hypothetical protein [Bacteroidia bacterium]